MCTFSHPANALSYRNMQEAKSHLSLGMCAFAPPDFPISSNSKMLWNRILQKASKQQQAKSHLSFRMCAFSPPNFPMNTERALTQNCPVPTVLRVSYHPARTSLQFSKHKLFFHLKIRLRALSARRFFKRCYCMFFPAKLKMFLALRAFIKSQWKLYYIEK